MAAIFMAAYTNYRRDPRVKREAEALVDAGHRVVFFASRQRGEPRRETIHGVEVIKTRAFNAKRASTLQYLLDYFLFFVVLTAHLTSRPRRYRLVHINNMPDFLVFAAWLPRLIGRPVIHDIHDLMPELYGEKFQSKGAFGLLRLLLWQERCAGRFATAVLTVEERLKDILSDRGIARDKIYVLMNLPDPRIFAQRAPADAKPPDAPFVLVYHGTLTRRLGLDIAIEAVAKAKCAIPEIELRIIGAGEERERLIELRDKLDLGSVVKFSEGFVQVEKIPLMIADADVGLVPLRISGGTDVMLPTKLLEYVCVGIPCIAPRTTTIARYFSDDMVRFFDGSATSLAEAIVDLYRHPEKRKALATLAAERFNHTYAWSEHKKVYTNLVETLLSKEHATK